MALTASAGDVSAKIKPHRPSWADMKLHYPDKTVSREKLYNEMIQGGFTNKHKVEAYANTCATRMSYALLRSGFPLHLINESLRGADKRWYCFRVIPLRAELVKRLKGYDAELKFDLLSDDLTFYRAKLDQQRAARKLKAQQFIDTHLKGKQGIVMFRTKGWLDAAGHFTLWDGKKNELAYAEHHDDPMEKDHYDKAEYYFWLTSTYPGGLGPLVQVTHIQFWELK